MSVDAAQFEPEIQDAEPHAGPDIRQMSQQRQLTHSPNSEELPIWISESDWTDCIKHDTHGPGSPVSIFTVPEFLKNTKKEAYVPQRVSLGPYHHRIAKFSRMRHYKGRALLGTMEKKLCNEYKKLDIDQKTINMMLRSDEETINSMLCSDPKIINIFVNLAKMLGIDENTVNMMFLSGQKNINMYFANRAKVEIVGVENEIRGSYEEKIDCDEQSLARMLCLDGCFLLQLLGTRDVESQDTAIWALAQDEMTVFVSRDIVNDILMLENQVPLIVLRKLLQLQPNSHDGDKMLLNMMTGFTCDLLKLEQWCPATLEVQHLLGFLYEAIVQPDSRLIENTDRGPAACSICIDCLGRCFMQHQDSIFIDCLGRRSMQHQDGLKRQFQRIRPAVELRNAGIKFKPCHKGIHSIKFDQKSATIFLPPICITDITEVLFRNLIAFEVCSFDYTYVSSYVNIMDNLIDSEKDVALLRKMGVLTNRLGRDNEVVDLFNSLSKATGPENLFGESLFYQLAKVVNAHYEKEIRVRLQLPKLVQDYCSTPWKALASAAAIVLLLLTLLQTIFSGMAVHK